MEQLVANILQGNNFAAAWYDREWTKTLKLWAGQLNNEPKLTTKLCNTEGSKFTFTFFMTSEDDELHVPDHPPRSLPLDCAQRTWSRTQLLYNKLSCLWAVWFCFIVASLSNTDTLWYNVAVNTDWTLTLLHAFNQATEVGHTDRILWQDYK